jgi:threonine dehydratase
MAEAVSFDHAMAAQAALAGKLDVTPVLPWNGSWKTGAAALLLKCENLQRTGSFKPRGALWFTTSLSPDERERGLVTVSAGNHAMGVAYAARVLGCRATVVMPVTASPYKAAGARNLGADVVLSPDMGAAFAEAMRLAHEEDMIFVHPFDDPKTIAGQATLTLELLDQVPDMDLLVMGVGGAGLLAGAAVALSAIQPDCRLVAVEPEGAATLTAAQAAGHPVALDHVDTIADGLAPPYVGHLNYDIVKKRVADVVVVSDSAIRRAMKALFESNHLVVEPAGAAALAALVEGGVDLTGVKRPVCVLSGGNMSYADFAREMAGLEGG